MTDGKAEQPLRILFVCNFNAIRSPIAAAVANRLLGSGVEAESAGVYSDDIDPFAVAVMREIDIDLSAHRSRSLEDVDPAGFDLVVTLTPRAHHRVLELSGEDGPRVEYWPCPDPTAAQGSRETILAAYRDLRSYLKKRLVEHFQNGGPVMA